MTTCRKAFRQLIHPDASDRRADLRGFRLVASRRAATHRDLISIGDGKLPIFAMESPICGVA